MAFSPGPNRAGLPSKNMLLHMQVQLQHAVAPSQFGIIEEVEGRQVAGVPLTRRPTAVRAHAKGQAGQHQNCTTATRRSRYAGSHTSRAGPPRIIETSSSRDFAPRRW